MSKCRFSRRGRNINKIIAEESDAFDDICFDELYMDLIKSYFPVLNKKEQMYLVCKYLSQAPDKEPVTTSEICVILDVKPSSLRKIEERIRRKIKAYVQG